MKTRVVAVPALILVSGIVTAVMLPVDGRLKALILASDCFAAILLGLVLWRQGRE